MLGRELRIVHWALMLRWPKEASTGPGISVFELAVNYLGVVGSPMPKVLCTLGCGSCTRSHATTFLFKSACRELFSEGPSPT